ncbi:MAG: hypothetical protein AABX00_01190 [Nanoarchaeota archaeon]
MKTVTEAEGKRILMLDDLTQATFELEELEREFPNLVDANNNFSLVEAGLNNGVYQVVIVDPFNVINNSGTSDKFSMSSDLVKRIKEKCKMVIVADSGISPTGDLGLTQGVDFDFHHTKPYNTRLLIDQVRELYQSTKRS